MKDIKVEDLKLASMIDKTNPDAARWEEILEMFKDESLPVALELLENMPYAIDSFIKEEMMSKPLSDLKPTFL